MIFHKNVAGIRKHETVDIVYTVDGRSEVETGLQPEPYDSD